MKKKKIIIGAIIVILLAAGIKPAYIYYNYKQEEKRFAQEPYYTEYKLTRFELIVMANKYHVDENPSWRDARDMADWPDYSYYTMEATEDTEMVVTVLNYWLFDERLEWDRGGWEKAEEYGFTADNRITVEWVMQHPKEAVEIIQATANEGDTFDDYQWIKREYNKITGASTQESTEQLEEATEQE